MGMESGDTTMNGEDAGETTASSPKKLRVKKKSTLAKLKEKKQRELGSSASLQKINSNKVENVFEDTLVSTNNSDITVNSGYIHLSTKDPPEPRKDQENSEKESRPKPKPRGSRRPSETYVDNLKFDNEINAEKKDSEKEKKKNLDSSETLGSSNDIKILGVEKLGSAELTLNQGGFIPKPPQTPRTPRTTPRTPRGYIIGKGEKKKHELESSCDEPEVQEKLKDVNDLQNSLEVPTSIKNSSDNVTSLNNSRRIPGQVKHGDRLLKRRSSKESLGESTNPYSSKPPINQSLTSLNNSNNNSNNKLNTGTNFLKSNSVSEPSKDRFLKFTKSSVPGQALQTTDISSSTKEKNLSHLSLTSVPNLESSIASSKSEVNTLHMHYERLLLSDLEDGNNIEAPQGSPLLDPISPKSQPPPLTKEFSSKSLRTSYKIDPNIKKITPLGQTDSTVDKADSGDCLSQKSYMSVSVLPLITTKEARLRIAPPERIIGTEAPDHLSSEIYRYFPERKVNVFVGTWNMNELKEVSTPLEDFLLPEKCDFVQDIYAIGTQENVTNKKEWEIKIQEVLGPSHVLYHSISHGSLHLVLFIRRDLIWFCSCPEDDIISLRALSMVKTKGAIGIYMTLFGTSYLFINCHLTSDRDNDTSRKKHRLGDYLKVIQDLKLPKGFQASPSAKKLGPEDITARFDCVFWFGDLNFRIEHERQTVVRKVNEITSEDIPNFEALLGADQLLKYMKEEKIFGGFQEGRINFHPTFKFDLNKDDYDTSSKNRVPSYTDRVMFRCKRKNDISCIVYDAVMDIKVSDHRPVFGHYETGIRPGNDNMVYGAAQFDRAVYLEANRRRASSKPNVKKQSSVCLIQ
ncbi:unnamed protein product [Lymnaea stagnalis]|uniref:Inositol polyphosphate-related phosphatase domain-containing protein n=1 Tax=Lymnaea stagnalis TaxID=6523 RepID=A0AAV2HLV4_LYMST